VGDRGQPVPAFLTDVDRHDHERQLGLGRHLEPAIDLLDRYGWGERPERLPHFHHGVDAIAHLGMAGVGEDAPVSQRPRAELHATTIPRHDPAPRDEPGGLRAGLAERGESLHLHPIAILCQCGVDVR